MSEVKSMEDFNRLKDQAMKERKARATATIAHVTVGMGTCGIAVGARDTMKAFMNYIERDHIHDIIVTQTGCIGLCEYEPIVQVSMGEEPKITYGKVTPNIAERIVKEHILGGKSIREYIVKD
jgi:NADP-reducing hydrogenase subunit HndB